MSKKSKSRRVFFFGVMVIIFLAMALRVLMFYENRSLFIDEASLSSQLIERPYSGLFDNLKYQYAPPLFAVAVKAMTDIFGANEYALRLLSLIASLIGIILFFQLCRQYLETKYSLFPLFLFSFGMPMLRYATEVKQYSSDVTIAIALLLICHQWKVEAFNTKRMLLFGLLGALVVWMSMPGVFLLFGIGIYYLYEIYKKKYWEKTVFVVGSILIWLLSFGIYYFTIIREDIGLKGLEDYHGRFFLPLIPTSMEEVQQFKNILLSFFQTAIGATVIAIAFGILTSIWALFYLNKRNTARVLLFTLPILAAMLASGLKLYSLIPRLTLFFIPILILLIGIGTAQLFERSPKLLKWLLLIPVFIILVNQKGSQYFYNRFQIEELRPVLYHVQDNIKTGDGVFLHYQAENAYVFYSQFYEDSERLNIQDIYIGDWTEPLTEIKLPEYDRLWLIFSHVGEEEIGRYVDYLKKGYVVREEMEVEGARVFLLGEER
ncbi:MAG: 4-amino-4-deoxy-L-arabinose transferase-like glycosyltransferase [Saprospiraceae bacterium]|jgi:4-amino-4-deoxy-L-arabinose transferase-like glycosyltransferase